MIAYWLKLHMHSSMGTIAFNAEERRSIDAKVRNAVQESLKRHWKLLELDVNERSVTHKVAETLQTKFSEFDVDCEYNRDGHDPKDIDIPIKVGEVYTNETKATTVYPDIILHKRDSKANVAVIEAKKNTNPDFETDIIKLEAFQSTLHYILCYRLVFEVGNGITSENQPFELEELSEIRQKRMRAHRNI